jgi:hypothetical protein
MKLGHNEQITTQINPVIGYDKQNWPVVSCSSLTVLGIKIKFESQILY